MNESRKQKLLSNPTRAYHPGSYGWYGYPSSVIDGAPWFTWFDVPRMLRDPQVRFILKMWRAPFQQVTWKVKAESDRVAKFVDMSLRRLWRRHLPMILLRYCCYGYAAGGVEFALQRGLIRANKLQVIEPRDARPLVWSDGPNKGERAGFSANSLKVLAPHAVWFAGNEEMGEGYDWPILAGMFEPWLEKRGRGGAIHSRRLWYRKCAFTGGTMYHPPGPINVGTDEDPQIRDAQDVARETLELYESGGILTFSNEQHPGIPGKYSWEFTPSESRADVAGVRDYSKDLDQEMLRGAGIPPEVLEASQVGSGWSGRMIPLLTYYGGVDEFVGPLIETFDLPIRHAAHVNFGASWFDVEPVPLTEMLKQQAEAGPGGKEGENPLAGLFGDSKPEQKSKPVSMSDGRGIDRKKKRNAIGLIVQAMLKAREIALRSGDPDSANDVIERLSRLASNPEQVEEILGGVQLSWAPYKGVRGGIGWINDKGRIVYGTKKPGEKREKAMASKAAANAILAKVRNYEATPEDIEALADHIPALTIERLRSVRIHLFASFGGGRRRQEMVDALLKHVKEHKDDWKEPEPEPETEETADTTTDTPAEEDTKTAEPETKPEETPPTAPQAAPEKPAELQADDHLKVAQQQELAKVPEAVTRQLSSALDKIRGYHEDLERGRDLDRKFTGEGRYESDVHRNTFKKNGIQGAIDFLKEFREVAGSEGVNADAVIEALGGLPDTSLSKSAREIVEDERQDEQAKAKPDDKAKQEEAPPATPEPQAAPATPEPQAGNRFAPSTPERKKDLDKLNKQRKKTGLPARTIHHEDALESAQKSWADGTPVDPAILAEHPYLASEALFNHVDPAAFNVETRHGEELGAHNLKDHISKIKKGTDGYKQTVQDAAKHLAIAWEYAHRPSTKMTDDDRRRLEEIIKDTVPGIHKIGDDYGQEVVFSGVRHEAPPGMFPGDKGRIDMPGWELHEDNGVVRIARKARIAPLGSLDKPKEPVPPKPAPAPQPKPQVRVPPPPPQPVPPPPPPTTPAAPAPAGDTGPKLGLINEKWFTQNFERWKHIADPAQREAAKKEYEDAVEQHERTLDSLQDNGFIRNRYGFRSKGGDFIAPGRGWVRKNPQTGKYDSFTNGDAVNHLRTVMPPPPAPGTPTGQAPATPPGGTAGTPSAPATPPPPPPTPPVAAPAPEQPQQPQRTLTAAEVSERYRDYREGETRPEPPFGYKWAEAIEEVPSRDGRGGTREYGKVYKLIKSADNPDKVFKNWHAKAAPVSEEKTSIPPDGAVGLKPHLDQMIQPGDKVFIRRMPLGGRSEGAFIVRGNSLISAYYRGQDSYGSSPATMTVTTLHPPPDVLDAVQSLSSVTPYSPR